MSVTLTILRTYSSEAHSDDACSNDHLNAVSNVLRRRHRHHGCFRAHYQDEHLGELLAQHGFHAAQLGTRGERGVPPLKRFVRSIQMKRTESAPQYDIDVAVNLALIGSLPARSVRQGGHVHKTFAVAGGT